MFLALVRSQYTKRDHDANGRSKGQELGVIDEIRRTKDMHDKIIPPFENQKKKFEFHF